MDPTKFDQFTKVLAHSTSRRRALKGFVVATVGGLFGLGTFQKISTVAAKGEDAVIIANRNSNIATSGSTSAAMGGNASAQTGPITETLPLSSSPVTGGGPVAGGGPVCLPIGSPCNAGRDCCSGGCSTFTSSCCLPSGGFCDVNTGAGVCCSGVCILTQNGQVVNRCQ